MPVTAAPIANPNAGPGPIPEVGAENNDHVAQSGQHHAVEGTSAPAPQSQTPTLPPAQSGMPGQGQSGLPFAADPVLAVFRANWEARFRRLFLFEGAGKEAGVSFGEWHQSVPYQVFFQDRNLPFSTYLPDGQLTTHARLRGRAPRVSDDLEDPVRAVSVWDVWVLQMFVLQTLLGHL